MTQKVFTSFYLRVTKGFKIRLFVFRYSLPILLTFLALIVKFYLISTINWSEKSLVLSTAVITISAWYGGFGPGVLATILNYFIIDYFFITPNVLLVKNTIADNLRIGVFIFEGIGISWLSESLHRARRKAEVNALRVYESEQFFRSLVENAKDYAIFMVNSKGTVISWNQGAAAIFGFQAEEVENKKMSKLFPLTDVEKNRLFKFLKLAKKKGRYENEDWKVRKDGSKFWANMIITPLRDNKKLFLGYSVIIRDLSQRKRIEDLKSEFLSIVAHELNTPLTIAKVISETVIKKFKKNHTSKLSAAELKDLDGELARLVILVNDLLDISRIETDKMVLAPKRVDLSKLVKKIVSKMGKITGNDQIVYRNHPKIWANFDPARIEQVLINLITNAIKYSDYQSEILINTDISDHQVTVSVKDSGQGIPKNELNQIFDQFYQGELSSNRGFGLGLYISKKIIDLHKGKVWVESMEGEGSTFFFSLPL